MSDNRTEAQLREAIAAGNEASAELGRRIMERGKEVEARCDKGPVFTDADLVYAAYSRCPCGAGMAYPKDISPHGFWDCSAILKGTHDQSVQHTGRLPFAFYEVKGEGQPSARGASTRPAPQPA
jgi:hypothetical protein